MVLTLWLVALSLPIVPGYAAAAGSNSTSRYMSSPFLNAYPTTTTTIKLWQTTTTKPWQTTTTTTTKPWQTTTTTTKPWQIDAISSSRVTRVVTRHTTSSVITPGITSTSTAPVLLMSPTFTPAIVKTHVQVSPNYSSASVFLNAFQSSTPLLRYSKTSALNNRVTITRILEGSTFLGLRKDLEEYVFLGAIALAGICLVLFIIVICYFKTKVRHLRRLVKRQSDCDISLGSSTDRNKPVRVFPDSVALKSFVFRELSPESAYDNPVTRSQEEPEVSYVTVVSSCNNDAELLNSATAKGTPASIQADESHYSNANKAPDSNEAGESSYSNAKATLDSTATTESHYSIAEPAPMAPAECHYSNTKASTPDSTEAVEPGIYSVAKHTPCTSSAGVTTESASSSPVYYNTSVLRGNNDDESNHYQQLNRREGDNEMNESHYASLKN